MSQRGRCILGQSGPKSTVPFGTQGGITDVKICTPTHTQRIQSPRRSK